MLKTYVILLVSLTLFFPGVLLGSDVCAVRPIYPCAPLGPAAAVYAGYATNGNMTDLKLTAQDLGIGGSVERRYDYNAMSGLSVGCGIPIWLSQNLVALFSAGMTLPMVSDLRADDYDADGVLAAGRNWKTDSMWGVAEGLLGYNVMCNACVMIGFRWDRRRSSFSAPFHASDNFTAHSDTDTADFNMEGHLPVVGMVVSGLGFSLGAVGFPRFYGSFEYDESRNGDDLTRLDKGSGSMSDGYLLEAFLEYSHPVIQLGESVQGGFSVFGQFNTIRATAVSTIERTGDMTAQDTYDLAYNGNFYVVGGKINIAFTVPFNSL